MIKRIGIIFLFLFMALTFTWSSVLASEPPKTGLVKLKSGDMIKVVVIGFPEYTMDYSVLSDGNVSGVGFGLIKVAGRTIPALQEDISKRLTRYVKNPKVAVVLTLERQLSIFVVSLHTGQTSAGKDPQVAASGAFPYIPEADLRSTISLAGIATPIDDYEVFVYRGGREFKQLELKELIKGNPSVWNGPMKPNDVVTVVPKLRLRVWILGVVRLPGEYLVRPEETIEQLLALSGGADTLTTQYNEMVIYIRRGPNLIEIPLRTESNSTPLKLQAGDTIVVQPPATIKVTISGYVVQPGVFTVPKGADIQSIVGSVSLGIQPTATLTNVVVVRGLEVLVVNVSTPDNNNQLFKLQDGDSIFVRENQNAFFVLGEVKTPGRFLMDDQRKEYRLSDTLAASGGTTDSGSLRRVTLLSVVKGKYEEKLFNLDEFLKDGKIESNPVVHPGDVVLFGRPKGFNAGNLLQVLPSLLVLNSLIKK